MASEQPTLVLHRGAGDLLELLADVTAKVAAGEVDILAIAFGGDSDLSWGWAWKDDVPAAFCRIHTASASMVADMMAEGL